ncbi:MAG: patatin-like phospholipase family protein [Bacteroidota bacterium]|nr:patatin-like phospholipase family protein [Bacteroidota bacterium]
MRQIIHKINFSLPIQLLKINLKKNRIILLLWILLFAIATGNFGKTYGVPYLFLDPEYLNKVNFWSLFILGVSFGIFTMAYNITIYILESYRFQFLMIQKSPFSKFSLNNCFFPLLFLIVFTVNFFRFQMIQGYQEELTILKELVGFYSGYFITLLLTVFYFELTGYAIFRKFTISLNTTLRQQRMNRVAVIQKIKMIKRKAYHTEYYIDFPFRFKKVESFIPYDKQSLSWVIDRNHLNALFLQVAGLITIFILGYFRDNPSVQIPAGASIMILSAIIAMIMGASAYWLKNWAVYAFLAIMIIINVGIQFDFINPDYQAFGLNYQNEKAIYSVDEIKKIAPDSVVRTDRSKTIEILNNWKAKFGSESKPKMVFICTSGGGQRAAVWTLRTLQIADSVTNNKLMQNTMLITGASGGLIGASYYRELHLRNQLGEKYNLTDKKYLNNISKDILNPIVFTLIINDMFVRYQSFSDGKYTYTKDRGYTFESQLNLNTEGVMKRKIMDYKPFEIKSTIPMLLLTPSIVNDGRKLYISPQGVAYMNTLCPENQQMMHSKFIGIEFMRFFKNQDAENMGFLSALRMSATFPYITPNVNLPSHPSMEIMDAGLTDNYGIADATRFAFVFKDWIKENTSGVVFMCIRDSPKLIPVERKAKTTIMDRIVNPIGTLYSNWDWLQDNTNEYYLEYASDFLGNKVKVINFEYTPVPDGWVRTEKTKEENDRQTMKAYKERASLSWHMTFKEKESLVNNIFDAQNLQSLKELKEELGN